MVKLCRPLGACHVVKSRFTCTFIHTCCFYSGSTIHIYPPISISRTTQKYSTPNPGENGQKYLCFPCEINAQVILLLPLATLSQEMSALKKEYEKIKRGKCPEPRKKRKSETRGKNRQVSDSRIRLPPLLSPYTIHSPHMHILI